MEFSLKKWFNVALERFIYPLNVSSGGWVWKGCFLHFFLLKTRCEGQCLTLSKEQKVTCLKTWIRGWEETNPSDRASKEEGGKRKKREQGIRHTLISFMNMVYITQFRGNKEYGMISWTLFLCSGLIILEFYGNRVHFQPLKH